MHWRSGERFVRIDLSLQTDFVIFCYADIRGNNNCDVYEQDKGLKSLLA